MLVQDPTLKHVVFKLEMSRVQLKEELRKAGGGMLDLEAELLKKVTTRLSSQDRVIGLTFRVGCVSYI
jgi:hypothetical protein